MNRTLASAVVSATLAFGLTACASNDPEPAATQWTNDVCLAFADLDTAVDELGDGLPPIDPTSGGSLSSAIDLVQAQVNQIRNSADLLGEALNTDLPPEATEGLEELRSELLRSADDARAQLNNVGTALSALINTPTVANLDELRTTVSTAKTDLNEIGDSLAQTTTDSRSELAETVRSAPACAPYLPPES